MPSLSELPRAGTRMPKPGHRMHSSLRLSKKGLTVITQGTESTCPDSILAMLSRVRL